MFGNAAPYTRSVYWIFHCLALLYISNVGPALIDHATFSSRITLIALLVGLLLVVSKVSTLWYEKVLDELERNQALDDLEESSTMIPPDPIATVTGDEPSSASTCASSSSEFCPRGRMQRSSFSSSEGEDLICSSSSSQQQRHLHKSEIPSWSRLGKSNKPTMTTEFMTSNPRPLNQIAWCLTSIYILIVFKLLIWKYSHEGWTIDGLFESWTHPAFLIIGIWNLFECLRERKSLWENLADFIAKENALPDETLPSTSARTCPPVGPVESNETPIAGWRRGSNGSCEASSQLLGNPLIFGAGRCSEGGCIQCSLRPLHCFSEIKTTSTPLQSTTRARCGQHQHYSQGPTRRRGGPLGTTLALTIGIFLIPLMLFPMLQDKQSDLPAIRGPPSFLLSKISSSSFPKAGVDESIFLPHNAVGAGPGSLFASPHQLCWPIYPDLSAFLCNVDDPDRSRPFFAPTLKLILRRVLLSPILGILSCYAFTLSTCILAPNLSRIRTALPHRSHIEIAYGENCS